MKALIAGGAGFVGSHLIDRLLQEGHEIVCIDNYSIGTKNNIEQLAPNSNFKIYEEDLCDIGKLNHIFENEKVDYVFHLAANSDIQASAENPLIEYRNTYTTTFNILECMRLYGVKKLFFSSTSAVYGERAGKEVSEDTPGLEPISYYGACKLGSEALISAFSYMNNLQSLIFRFPNVVGPRLTHGVIFDFIKKLKNNPKELEILGNGLQRKPYMYVSDLVDAIVKYKDVEKRVEIYNIGVSTQTSVNTIADIICEEMGLKDVVYKYTGGTGGWKGDVPVFAYNLDKIKNTGWRPRYESDEAVRLTVKKELNKI